VAADPAADAGARAVWLYGILTWFSFTHHEWGIAGRGPPSAQVSTSTLAVSPAPPTRRASCATFDELPASRLDVPIINQPCRRTEVNCVTGGANLSHHGFVT